MTHEETMKELQVEVRYMKKNIDNLVGKVDIILKGMNKIEMIEGDIVRIEKEIIEIKKDMVSETEFKPYRTSRDIIRKALMMALAGGIVYLLKIGG